MSDRALLYQEPDIVTILTLSSFLLFLNIVGYVLDKAIYCGLIGQILIGVAYGTPGSQILPRAFEDVTTNLGYLGLMLLVFEGGLTTSVRSLGANLHLSLAVATTGTLLPIAFSFSLYSITQATGLQAFAAGCALCSTSLGTTLSVLKTTGLTTSRLGTVLTSAAMLDDVVGLVMVQVISNLGDSTSSFSATTIVRPIFVSVAYALVVPLTCILFSKPISSLLNLRMVARDPSSGTMFARSDFRFLICTVFLAGLCTSSSYAGTSNLFAAYLAGAAIAWFDETSRGQMMVQSAVQNESERALHGAETSGRHTVQDCQQLANEPGCENLQLKPPINTRNTQVDTLESMEGAERTESIAPVAGVELNDSIIGVYEYFMVPVERILKPMFFASIGFSIPITQLFHGRIFWRGLLYGILMILAKLACGLWLVRFSTSTTKSVAGSKGVRLWPKILPKPKSLYPASLLGCAMVARGEIGFLISAMAQSRGIFTDSGSHSDTSHIFLVVTWAILICTITGPIAVGLLARRVRKIQAQERTESGGRVDPLGPWGIGVH